MAKKLQENLDHIKKAVVAGKYHYTIHGAEQRIARRIKRKDIEKAIENGRKS